MAARSEVMCSMPPSAAWKARLFCVSWPLTLPSVLTIMSRPIAIPDMMTNSIRDAIRVNPREPRFVQCIVSLLIPISNCSCVSISISWFPAWSRPLVVAILVTQISRADRSLRIETLVAFACHDTAGAGHLAANCEMNQIDLANQVEGRAQGISGVAHSVEQVAAGVVGVIGELQVDHVFGYGYGGLPVDLAHQGRGSGPHAEGIGQ